MCILFHGTGNAKAEFYLVAAVTTPRADVMSVATEFGVANLWNKTVTRRVEAMISIVHPDFCQQLAGEAEATGLLP